MLFATNVAIKSLVSIRNYIALKQCIMCGEHRAGLVSIRNYIALKRISPVLIFSPGLVSIRNYIALKQIALSSRLIYVFSIHTKLHRSKTSHACLFCSGSFSIHTKLHRSKTISDKLMGHVRV